MPLSPWPFLRGYLGRLEMPCVGLANWWSICLPTVLLLEALAEPPSVKGTHSLGSAVGFAPRKQGTPDRRQAKDQVGEASTG